MAQSYRFGHVDVRPAERRLLIDGNAATIGARAFDVLITLIENRERMVSKNELLERVWPGVIVEENNLQVQISTLRKLLGATSVATIAGRGYRFALVSDADGDGESNASARADVPDAAAPTRDNLPAPLNRFIGREREIAEVRELLVSNRLVTLTGVGGTGKTRLSLQVAALMRNDFPAGVWFVELAALTDPQLVPQAVALVLDVREKAGRPVVEALVNHVRDRRLLLVLDNCEALLQGCADLARALLQAGSHLTILTSSRERLRLAGEVVYAVRALATPGAHPADSAVSLAQFDAVRLFVDRAKSAQPAFRLSEKNAAAVAEICNRLDGLPLAIELAAARLLALSAEKIAARLNDRFRLLGGGAPSAIAHHETLRASIDWSYDLLSEAERTLLRRLSVFAGGWTIDAAEAIGADQSGELVDNLSALVEKSLVALDADGERYRLLETVRAFVLEKLAASGEAAAVRNRHLTFYLALVEQVRSNLYGAAQGSWLTRLDAERENLLAAHTWCETAVEAAESGLQLVCAIKFYWLNRGLLGLGRQITVEALGRSGAQNPTLLRCRALIIAGQLDVFMGHYAEAPRFLEESLLIARELGDQARIASVLMSLGVAAMGRADLPAAHYYLQEALALALSLGNPRDLCAALTAVAQLHRVEGNLDLAEPLYQQAITLARELDDRESVAIGLLNLAMVSIAHRNVSEALTMLQEVAAIIVETGSKPAAQSLLEVSAGLAGELGDWPLTARWFGAAEAQAAQTGLHRDPGDAAFLLPLVTRARTAIDASGFAVAEAAGRALSCEQAVAEAAAWLALRKAGSALAASTARA